MVTSLPTVGRLTNLVTWCNQNNLELNALMTVEMVVDFRKPHLPPSPSVTPQLILWSPSANLGTIISQDLKWKLNISSLIKKAEDVLPAAAEEIQPAKDNDGALLLLHH